MADTVDSFTPARVSNERGGSARSSEEIQNISCLGRVRLLQGRGTPGHAVAGGAS